MHSIASLLTFAMSCPSLVAVKEVEAECKVHSSARKRAEVSIHYTGAE